MTTYDRDKHYQWNPNDKFEISGGEFGLILNTFRAILNTEQAAQILLADRANSVIEKIMTEYVEKGIIKEVQQQNDVSPLKIIGKDEKE